MGLDDDFVVGVQPGCNLLARTRALLQDRIPQREREGCFTPDDIAELRKYFDGILEIGGDTTED